MVGKNCQLVLVFGSNNLLSDTNHFLALQKEFPSAHIVMSSTAGEIADITVSDDTLSMIAVEFEKTKLKTASVQIGDENDSFGAGKSLGSAFDADGLVNVLIFSDGQKVNGSDLVAGLKSALPNNTIITGGLAGDGPHFKRTLVGLNEPPLEGRIVGIGFYGENLQISFGSIGGWDSFGHERLITKSKENILFELDGKPALDIYKQYLGEFSKDLPASALLFPLSLRANAGDELLVRTILGIDEETRSMIFAGNMPQGGYARLMKANLDRLIEGAGTAAQNAISHGPSNPELAVLVSCVGRKLVLSHRIEEEVEMVRAALGPETVLTGFYSYGEISPSGFQSSCELHNQTMTITTFREL